MKKALAILLAVVMIAAVAACGNQAAPTPAPGGPGTGAPPASPTANPGVLTPGQVIQAPETPGAQYADLIEIISEMNVVVIDPQAQGGTASINRVTYQMVYDRLLFYDAVNNELLPELATSWDVSGDLLTYTFNLRDDVYFHNGDKFTAQHVVDTALAGREALGSLASDQWKPVRTVTAVNDTTVRFDLNAPSNAFAYNMAMPGGAIINKAAREADPVAGAWVGTGAFYVSDFISGNFTQLTRNDNYWGTAPLTRVLNIRFVPEVAARTIMVLNGDTDVCTSISPTDLDMFVAANGYTVYGYAANSTSSLTFGLLDPITGDLNFRKAVAHAINRDDIAVASTGNWAKPAPDGAFWGDSTPFRNTSIPQLEHDLDKAREYLAQSVYNGEVIDFLCGPDTLALGGLMIQEQLNAIGINVNFRSTDVPTLVGGSQYGNENLQLLHFVSPFELNPASARVMLYPGMSANRASYNNPEVNELLDKVETIADPREQEAIFKQIQLLVSYDIPQLSLYERIWGLVTDDKVGGIRINPDMNHDFRGIFMTLD